MDEILSGFNTYCTTFIAGEAGILVGKLLFQTESGL